MALYSTGKRQYIYSTPAEVGPQTRPSKILLIQEHTLIQEYTLTQEYTLVQEYPLIQAYTLNQNYVWDPIL